MHSKILLGVTHYNFYLHVPLYTLSHKLLTLQPPFGFPVDPCGPGLLFHTFPFPSCRLPARPTVIDSVPFAETLAPVFGGFSQTQMLSTKHIHSIACIIAVQLKAPSLQAQGLN